MSAPDISGRWQPPPNVYDRGTALQRQIPHRFGTIVAPGEVGQKPIQPGTAAMKTWLLQHFPGTFSSIGAARSPASRWATVGQQRDLHQEGRALDLMTGDQAALERFANALVWHAAEIGLQYVLTRRLEWSASGIGAAWELYGPEHPSPHTDHVHVELSPQAAADPARVVAALDRALAAGWDPPPSSPATSPSRIVTGAAAVLTGAAALVAGGAL